MAFYVQSEEVATEGHVKQVTDVPTFKPFVRIYGSWWLIAHPENLIELDLLLCARLTRSLAPRPDVLEQVPSHFT